MSVLIFDPLTENASNVQLDVAEDPYTLTALAYPAPAADPQYASSVDTEGERPVALRHRNRELRARIDCAGLAALRDLDQKIAKLGREGGTARVMQPDGTTVTFDVVNVMQYEPAHDHAHEAGVTVVEVALECKPYGRGVQTSYTAHTESTLPALVFTETDVPGDVPGLGTLTVTEAQGADQFFLMWGVQSRYYDPSADAALFYQAESRTAQGGSATAAGPTGASGSGSNVMRNTGLTTTYQSILSTQASGGGNHLAHVGAFQVWARISAPVPAIADATITLGFEWSTGDFHTFTRNDPITLTDTTTQWLLVNLGQVTIPEVAAGTQRWEGRIIAKGSSNGYSVDVDCLFFMPVLEGYGEVRGITSSPSPTTISSHDEFDQTAGALAGKTAAAGGNWAGAGDADDFTVDAGTHTANRTAISDADLNTGRYAILGTTTYTNVAAQVTTAIPDAGQTTSDSASGVVVRYTDTNNWVMATFDLGGGTVIVRKRVAGTVTTIGTGSFPIALPMGSPIAIMFTVYASGAWSFSLPATSYAPIEGVDSDLATGGTLASGKAGIYDAWTTATANTRVYDDFSVDIPSRDAAVFASQTLQIQSDRVIREDATGVLYQGPSAYEGDYLLVPPAGLEGRTIRVIVKASRNDPGSGADSAIDDITAQLTVTPRYLVVA